MTPDHDSDSNGSQVTLPMVAILTLIFSLIALSYITLDRNKLEKSVFDEHNKAISMMGEDIRAIRSIIDQHSLHPEPPKH